MTEHDIRQSIKGIYRGDLAEAHMLNHALQRIEEAMEPDLDDEGDETCPLDEPGHEKEGD
jgi:hypothetical protein